MIINSEISEGDSIKVDLTKGKKEINFLVVKKETNKTK
jgi:hypothetical protein